MRKANFEIRFGFEPHALYNFNSPDYCLNEPETLTGILE